MLTTAPVDGQTQRVCQIWEQVLGVPVGADDDFFALGGDSFAAVRAVRALDADLRVVELFTHPTPRALAGRLRQGADAPITPSGLLHRLTPVRPVELALVCFPHGGGDAVAYGPLARALPDHIGLWAVSPPGHDPTRPAPLVTVEELARTVSAELAGALDVPVVVYGHCAGVVPALETAHQLERAGRPALALHLAAALPESDPQWSLRMERESSDADVVSHLRSMGGFDGVLDERDLDTVVRIVRHDMVESARFFAATPQGFDPVLRTPLTCIFGDADDATEGFAQAHLAWGRYARLRESRVIAGAGHYFAKHLPGPLAALLTELYPPNTRPVLSARPALPARPAAHASGLDFEETS